MNKHDEYCLRYQALHDGTGGWKTTKGDPNVVHKDEKRRLFDGSNFFEKLYTHFNKFVAKRDSVRVLDFGCGKAKHLTNPVLQGKMLHQALEGKLQSYYCYDPGFKLYSKPPSAFERFDVLICADVMEHIPEEYVDDVLLRMQNWIEPDGLALFSISGIPAVKMFEDGENLHINTKDITWWQAKLDTVLQRDYVLVHTGKTAELTVKGER